jgi:hypothetical protein
MRTSLKALATAALTLTLTFGASGVANAAGFVTVQGGATGCCRTMV